MARDIKEDAPQTQRYVVTHGGVGQHWKGQVVGSEHFPEGTDMERLIRLGALAPEGSADASVTMAGIQPGELTPEGTSVMGTVPPPYLTTGNPSQGLQNEVTAQHALGNLGASPTNTSVPAKG